MSNPNLKVGERFSIGYDPKADPTGAFKFLQTAKFEVTEVGPGFVKTKRIK